MADLSSITTFLTKFREWMSFQASSSVDPPTSSSQLSPELTLEEVQRMVARIKAVLRDAEEREIHDESVRIWLKDLRDVAYEADDLVGEYEYELLRLRTERPTVVCPPRAPTHQEVCNDIATSTCLTASFWFNAADKIQKIRGKVEEISRMRDTLHLREGDGQRRPRNVEMRPPTSHLPDVTDPRGREDDLKKVTAMLLSDECTRSDLFVIPIVGVGGVGKTTLAQLVYNNPEVCGVFALRGWVSVSDHFDLVTLARKISEVLTRAEQKLNELSALQEMIISTIKGKRFLLVLDDVWNEDSDMWDRLMLPLKLGKQGSAVISTTRSLNVARIMSPLNTDHHHLNCLSIADCWEVLKRSAFRMRHAAHEDYHKLLGISKQIANKCKGLPLAAKSLGSLLSYDYDVESWKAVLESDVWDVDDKIIPALMLSYVHLPSHLKQCFLYASMFPKDSVFSKDELVRLWMAQGFVVQSGADVGLEIVGNRYFDEVMNRSFFQRNPVDPSLFTMHDLIHDLAQYISRGEHMIVGKPCRFPVQEARHLSFFLSDREGPPHSSQPIFFIHGRTSSYELVCSASKAARTILALPPTVDLLELITTKMMSLRALGLRGGAGFRRLPEAIGKNLKHLRYLSLEQTGIRELPDSVGKLYHLQTLILRGTQLQRLPTSITDLTNLRCLEVGSGFTQMPRGISRLTRLRSLDVFNVGRVDEIEGCAGVEELGPLQHLRGSLAINNLEYVVDPEKAKEAFLVGKEITGLELNWHCHGGSPGGISQDHQTMVLENLYPCGQIIKHLTIRHYRGAMLPRRLAGLSRLAVVEIVCPELIALPPFGQLPCLKCLEVRQGVTVETVGFEFRGGGAVGFRALEELVFEDMSCWTAWQGVRAGDFPRLRRLVVDKCPQLTSTLPLYHLPALEELVLQHCEKLASIELWSPPPSSPSSARTLPPLKVMGIQACPRALFPPAGDERPRLPSTLHYLFIDYDCPLLVEWCLTKAGKRALSAVPDAKVWRDPNGSPFVSTADHGGYELA